MRRLLPTIGLILSLGGCTSPQLVDCDPGRFVRLEGDVPWCVYAGTSGRCPSLLPEEHELPWGGRGCAPERFEPLPDGLCEAAGACGDGGP